MITVPTETTSVSRDNFEVMTLHYIYSCCTLDHKRTNNWRH